MKLFFIKLSLFTLIVIAIVFVFLTKHKGYVDYFYGKFTTEKKESLILGDSRSFQGIMPSVIDENFKNQYKSIYNYSFTIAQTSYGDCYLNSIKKKLKPNASKGLYILSVHPLLFMEREGDDVNKGKYFEEDMPPHNMSVVDMDPNVEYFFKNYSYFHFKAFQNKITFLQDDGLLVEKEVKTDAITANKLKLKYLDTYVGFFKKWKKSNYRLEKFKETIEYLKAHGTVVLVRMPTTKEILAVENKYWNNFDELINKISSDGSVNYFNYSKTPNFETSDGVHLSKKNIPLFTQSLCDSIKKYNN